LAGLGVACPLLHGGCAHAPRQANAPAPAPSTSTPTVASNDATPTVSVDLNRSVGENTTFHKSATDRQKFQIHIDFGKVFEAQGNLERAVQEYQDALKVAQARGRGELTAADEALAHRRIASALDRQGQFHQSEAHYQKAEKLAPKDPKVWNDAGYSLYLQGRWADAERSFRTAMKLAPNDARVRTNLGMTLGAAGKTREALHLLSAHQGDAIGHANLGYLLASTGQYQRAREEYQVALTMRPDMPLAQRALAQLDRQERGITPPAATVAHNGNDGAVRSGTMDPQVTRTSAPATDEILPPPLPPPLPPEPSTQPQQ
jgi:tetratricopeptide (TPR) repeat protein